MNPSAGFIFELCDMKPKLRAITFLAPNMFHVYRFVCEYVGARLGYEIELSVGTDYQQAHQADLTFICGLPYVLLTKSQPILAALAAPVLKGDRFQNRPIYFSDVIVHRDSPFQCFADLRRCSWAYNEPESQSGYGITRYHLLKLGETSGYFGEVIETGFHQKSIQMVCGSEVDASAIDAQVLAVELRDHPEIADQLRVIHSLGPSTIQPIAAAMHLSSQLKQDIQTILTELHLAPTSKSYLDSGFIDHFTSIGDADYDDIREMLTLCGQAHFLQIK
jgi:phosphonate transport system substrate-binding protein